MLLSGDGRTFLPRSGQADTQTVRAAVYTGLAMLDICAVFMAFFLADVLRHGEINNGHIVQYFLIVPVFLAVNFYSHAYAYSSVVSLRRAIMQVAMSLPVAIALTLIVIFATKSSEDISRVAFFFGSALSLIFLIALRLPLPRLVTRLGTRFMRRILIVDEPFAEIVPPMFEVIDATRAGIKPDTSDPLMLHHFSQIVAGADRVIVACPIERRENWSMYLKSVGCVGELLVPELRGIKPLHREQHLGLVGIPVSTGSLDMRNRILKRGFDLSLAISALILLAPLLLFTAAAIKLESRGPILFRQRRMGRANQLFDVYKFRSMRHEGADHAGSRSTSRDDDRITRVGRFIRATSIDELPQLFNIISGDMSLVGPRPHALGSRAGEALFWHVDERYWLRHAIKPGLTGLAQVRGFRGATDHPDDLARRLASDLDYLSEWSVFRDVTILLRTLLVLRHKNAY